MAAAGVAVGRLAWALVTNDYTLTYVADFARRDASAPYRLAALWGGMAGSLLWFATLVGGAGWWAARRVPEPRVQGRMVALTGGLLAALIGLVLAFADPFQRLAVPALDGAGLTPILEHPAMLYHPPLLYLGLATLTGPFALTVAMLTTPVGGRGFAGPATVRRWLMLPWILLAVGMLAGAHWAYVELGWGGYWAWDPVENTALLPWLALTLALHAHHLQRPHPAGDRVDGEGDRDVGQAVDRGVAALVCLAFLLALVGAMLTRSGAVSSVHAFAESRAIGRALGVLVGLVAAGVTVLLLRTRRRRPGPVASPTARVAVTPSRTVGWLLVAHLAVGGTVLAVAFTGTVAPLVTDLRGGDGIAIEGRYFASFAGPLATIGLALLTLVPVARRLSPASSPGRPLHGNGDVDPLAVPQDASIAPGETTAPDHEADDLLAAVDSAPQRPGWAGRDREEGDLRGARRPGARWAELSSGARAKSGRGSERASAAGSRRTATWLLGPGRSVIGVELLPIVVGVAVAMGLLVLAGGDVDVPRLALAGAAGAALASASTAAGRKVVRREGALGADLAHAGLGLLLLGVAGTASGVTETLPVQPGDRLDILGQSIEYQGVTVVDGSDQAAGQPARQGAGQDRAADVDLPDDADGGPASVVATVDVAGRTLEPSLVAYPARGVLLAETSLVSTPLRDVQVALRDAGDDGSAVLEIGVHPLQVLVWWGGLLIVAAGLVTARDHRRPRHATHPSPTSKMDQTTAEPPKATLGA